MKNTIKNYQATPAEMKSWIKQIQAINGGLIGVGIVMIQPFLVSPGSLESLPAKICVISFAIALPILSALLLLNYEEAFRNRLSTSGGLIELVRTVAIMAAITGIVAGFWHIYPSAGIVMIVAGIIGFSACFLGYKKLYGKKIKAQK